MADYEKDIFKEGYGPSRDRGGQFESDALHDYNFCDLDTFNRLTDQQKACLTLSLGSACADGNVFLNSDPVGTVASGSFANFNVHDTGGLGVGSLSGPNWVIGDATVSINGNVVRSVEAEGAIDIDVLQGGLPVGSPVGNQWIIPPAPDATAENSNSSYSLTIGSGGTDTFPDTVIKSTSSNFTDTVASADPAGYTIADVGWTDSDLTPQTTEYGQPIVCTPFTPAGVTLAVSDGTPSYGDVVTLTATPVSTAPTSYTFYIPKTFGGYTTVTQASNVYAWTVDFIGEGDALVSATDGSSNVYSDPVSIDVDGLPLDYIESRISSACALKQLTVTWTGSVVSIRRSSDNATSDFTATELSDGTAVSWVGGGNIGYVTAIYDQSGNGRYMFQSIASYQGIIIEGGALITDSAGNPAYKNQRNDQAMRIVGVMASPINNLAMVGSDVSGINGVQAWIYTSAGNPSVGTYTTNPANTSNATTNAGTPTYYGNGVPIPNQRGPLGAHIIGNLAITTVMDSDYSNTWRSTDITTYLLFADTNSKFTFGILSNQFDSSERSLLEEKMNDLYGYY